MKSFALATVLCLAVSTVQATPLDIVEVGAPAINCKFDTDCRIYVDDFADYFALPGTTGNAFLQSRSFPVGEPGTVAEGLYPYLYRIDLRPLTGLAPCIQSFTINFGPIVPIDYNDDGRKDQVFVVTRGGTGMVRPSFAEQIGNTIAFYFDPEVCVGQDTFFIGLVSTNPPVPVRAKLTDTSGRDMAMRARAPETPREIDPILVLVSRTRFLRGDPDGNGIVSLPDAIAVLDYLFVGMFEHRCLNALDFDDNNDINMDDAVSSLVYQFLGGSPPAPPTGSCGYDLTPAEGLDCESYPPEHCGEDEVILIADRREVREIE